MSDKNEPLLTALSNRFVMFPIRYNAIWNMYKKAESAFWTAEEIDLSKDLNDWEKLTDSERYFIKHVLAFFAGSDGIVNENLSVRFMNEVAPPEAKAFYGFQIAMENIHCVTGDTEILTTNGYQSIEFLAKHSPDVSVWNGHEFSRTRIVKTSDSATICNVILSNGMSLKCTTGHKWLIQGHNERVVTEQLLPGMLLEEFDYPSFPLDLCDPEIFMKPYEHGCAILSEKDNYDPVSFGMRPRMFVPVNFSIDTKVQWLNGLLQNGHVVDNAVVLICTHIPLARSIQKLLSTLSVYASIQMSEDLPTGIMIDAHNIKKLTDIGVHAQVMSVVIKDEIKRPKDIHVVKVVTLPDPAPTYCFNEPNRHTGIFDGVLTGQSETYSLLIDTYIKDSQEKTHLLNAINTIPCIGKKADWALRWIESKDACFAKRLIAFACVEGIFFSGAFCSIFWLKERGVMPGLCLSNEFISRDEGLHTEFAVLLYSHLNNKLPEDTIHAMVREAVEIEDEFITESIPCNMLGMNAALMSQYIRFVADRLIVQLGYEKIWNVTNPFSFMDRIGLESKSNFFEHTRISEYAKANVGSAAHGATGNNFTFSISDDF